MCRLARRSHEAVRAALYNQYAYDLAPFDSVETLVLKNRAASTDAFVLQTIRKGVLEAPSIGAPSQQGAHRNARRESVSVDEITVGLMRLDRRCELRGETLGTVQQARADALLQPCAQEL